MNLPAITDDLVDLARVNLAPDELADDADVQRMVEALQQRFGEHLLAVLMYGSYLRGKRDTVMDFYVLLDVFGHTLPHTWHIAANKLLPPNVYYLRLEGFSGNPSLDDALLAKYAVLTLTQFEHANKYNFHSYFWARFTQPSRLVFCKDQATAQHIARSVAQAAITFVSQVLPVLPKQFTAAQLWHTGFSLTYRAELRSERQDRLDALYDNNTAYLDAVAVACLSSNDAGDLINPHKSPPLFAGALWRIRQAQGKILSVLRLVKAAGTFADPLDYLLWKIHRHSGIYIEPTDRQRRYPLIFAWGLLWRLYRQGAFR